MATYGVLNEILTAHYSFRHGLRIYDEFDFCCRLRDERGDMERVMAMDKAREGSHNGNYLTST